MVRPLIGIALALVASWQAGAAPVSPSDPATIPPALQAWQAWVQTQDPTAHCHWQQLPSQRRCALRSIGELTISQQQGSFEQHIQLDSAGFVALPGDDKHWPLEVTATDLATAQVQTLAVKRSNGEPQVYLEPGQYRLRMQFRWPAALDYLPFPSGAPAVSLTRDGQPEVAPRWDGQRLLLSASEQSSVADSLSIRLFRLFRDGVPQQLTSRAMLSVTGKQREVTLELPLPAGFVISQLDSDLSYQLQADGQLRLSLLPGEYELEFTALNRQSQDTVQLAPVQAPWPAEEVWSYQPSSMRHLQVEQAQSIDPSISGAPEEWATFAQYQLQSGTALRLSPLSRGQELHDELELNRQAWLVPSQQRWLFNDELSGTRRTAMALSVFPPFIPGRVELAGNPVLVGQRDGQVPAIELRESQLQLSVVGAEPYPFAQQVHPYGASLNRVRTELHLPTGWRALAVFGVDHGSGDWLSQWQLWDVFLLVLTAVASYRLLGMGGALLWLSWLLLSYQQAHAPVWAWLNALVGLGLWQLASRTEAVSKLTPWLLRYYQLALVIVVVQVLPYITQSFRLAVFPQLDRPAFAMDNTYADRSQHIVLNEAPQAARASRVEQKLKQTLASSADYERIEVTGSRIDPLQQEPELAPDASAQVQTGPALPSWQGRTVTVVWQGDVQAEQQWQLYVSPAWLTRLGDLASGLLALAMLALLTRPWWGQGTQWLQQQRASLAVLPLLLLVSVASPSADASKAPEPPPMKVQPQADGGLFPSQALLDELKQRLERAHACQDECVSISELHISNDGDWLQLSLQAASVGRQLLQVPLPATRVAQVSIDGKPGLMYRDGDVMYVAVPDGVHQLIVKAPLHGVAEQVLSFGQYWHHLQAELRGWQVQQNSNTAEATSGPWQLIIRRDAPVATGSQTTVQVARLQPLLQLERVLQPGYRSKIITRVSRLADETSAVELRYPLLPGERPLVDWPVVDGMLQIPLGAGQEELVFQSSWQPEATVQLKSQVQSHYLEQWRIRPSDDWHVEIGDSPQQPLVDDVEQDALAPLWRPWPGEQLTLQLSRPSALKGDSLTVHQSGLNGEVGAQGATWTFGASVLTSQAQNWSLGLPEAAVLQQVSINGQVIPLRLQQQQLQLPLPTGRAEVSVTFRTTTPLEARYSPPMLTSAVPLNNFKLAMELPHDRWMLALGGEAEAQSVMLFWGSLLLAVVLALAVARSGFTPLSTLDSLLLFVGFSTQSLFLPLWVCAAFAMVRLLKPHHRGLQLLRILSVLVAVISLIAAVPLGLLSYPDMHWVQVDGQWQGLRWFSDQVSQTPSVWAFSLPIWAYKFAMLLWALWLASAMLRWLPWAWQQLTRHGLWPQAAVKSRSTVAPAVTPVDAPTNADAADTSSQNSEETTPPPSV